MIVRSLPLPQGRRRHAAPVVDGMWSRKARIYVHAGVIGGTAVGSPCQHGNRGRRDRRILGVGWMTADYRPWSGPARAMALAVDAAVSAAQSGDAAAFTDATASLGRVDREQLAVLLGAITRDLLERSHPNGLDSEDAEQVLQSCIRSAAPWYEAVDSDALVGA